MRGGGLTARGARLVATTVFAVFERRSGARGRREVGRWTISTATAPIPAHVSAVVGAVAAGTSAASIELTAAGGLVLVANIHN